jgi:hypothetical protein
MHDLLCWTDQRWLGCYRSGDGKLLQPARPGRFETMHACLPLQTDDCALRRLQKAERTQESQW